MCAVVVLTKDNVLLKVDNCLLVSFLSLILPVSDLVFTGGIFAMRPHTQRPKGGIRLVLSLIPRISIYV
jgi:hypothetical protein